VTFLSGWSPTVLLISINMKQKLLRVAGTSPFESSCVMAYLVFLLALLLGGCGGYVLYLGFDDLTTQRGFAYTMSGTVAFCAALLLLTAGFGLLWLKRLVQRLDRMAIVLAERPLAAASSADGIEPPIVENLVLGAVEEAILADIEPPQMSAPPPPQQRPTVPPEPAGKKASSNVFGERWRGAAVGLGAGAVAGAAVAGSSAGRDDEHAAGQRNGAEDEAATAPEPERPAEPVDRPSTLAATHAEIDRLLDELAAGDPFAAPGAKRDRASDDALPPEPPFYRQHALDVELAPEPVTSMPASEGVVAEEVAPTSYKPEVEPEPHSPEPVEQSETLSDDQAFAPEGIEAVVEPPTGEPEPEPEPDQLEPAAFSDEDLAPLDPLPPGDPDELREATHREPEPGPEREVIGSYESAGVTYTLFADGSVVAESQEAREEYPSLEALRHAFERGESVFSA